MKTDRTLILGLGNPILSDDRIGLVVARMVAGELGDEVDLIEAAVAGVAILDIISGYGKLLVIDSMAVEGCENPGRLHRLRMEDLGPPVPAVSHHGTGLASVFETGRIMGYELPEDVEIYAIEIEPATEFGEDLSNGLSQSLPSIVETIIRQSFKG